MQKATRNQSNSQIWRLQRKGRVTASRFHEVDKKMQVIYRNRLKPVKCKVTPLSLSIAEPKELKNIESIKRGKTNEKYAAENLMKMEGKKHQNPKLLTCGLYSFKPHPYLGATPDNVLNVTAAQNYAWNTNAHIKYEMKVLLNLGKNVIF